MLVRTVEVNRNDDEIRHSCASMDYRSHWVPKLVLYRLKLAVLVLGEYQIALYSQAVLMVGDGPEDPCSCAYVVWFVNWVEDPQDS